MTVCLWGETKNPQASLQPCSILKTLPLCRLPGLHWRLTRPTGCLSCSAIVQSLCTSSSSFSASSVVEAGCSPPSLPMILWVSALKSGCCCSAGFFGMSTAGGAGALLGLGGHQIVAVLDPGSELAAGDLLCAPAEMRVWAAVTVENEPRQICSSLHPLCGVQVKLNIGANLKFSLILS